MLGTEGNYLMFSAGFSEAFNRFTVALDGMGPNSDPPDSMPAIRKVAESAAIRPGESTRRKLEQA